MPLIDKGNERVQQRREAFELFQGGKAGDQLGDAIGRAWAVGLFDGQTQDAAILRDIGRRYAAMHAIVFRQTAICIGELEPRSRGSGDGGDDDPIGERFTSLDTLAKSAGPKAYQAMRKLCVEGSPDENPAWLDRLITVVRISSAPVQNVLKRNGAFVAGGASDRDRMILAQATAALVAMVEG